MKKAKKDKEIKLRTTNYEIKMWKAAAKKEKISLSKFARMALNSRANYKLVMWKKITKIITKNMNKPRKGKKVSKATVNKPS